MSTFRGNAGGSGSRYAPPEPHEPSISLSLSPQHSLSAREAEYQLTVENSSDWAESLALFVDSPALNLRYTFEPSHLRVAAHAQSTARLRVRAWSAPEARPHAFIVSALRAGSSGPVARAAGQFVPEFVARSAGRSGAYAKTPLLLAGALLLLVCATGVMALFARQAFHSREGDGVVAHANPTAAVTAGMPVTGVAGGSAAAATPTPAPATPAVPPAARTPAPSRGPAAANPEVALRNYYSNIDMRAYAVTWDSLSPRFQSEVNQNDMPGYENFWNSVAQVTVLDTKLVSQVNETATVRAALRYAYVDGSVVDETTTFRLIADAGRHQWLIDAVVK